MSLHNHIKEHQTLWGIIIGILGISIISAVFAVRMIFFHDSSSSSSTASQPNVRSKPQYQETSATSTYTNNKVKIGTITKLSDNRTITVSSTSSNTNPQTFTIPESADIKLFHHFEAPKDNKKSSLAFAKLRVGDKVNVYFTNKDSPQVTLLKVHSTSSTPTVREPAQFTP